MWSEHLRVGEDVSAAAWLGPRLTGAPGAVTGSVPSGYPAYARICHPAEAAGRRVTWTEVAATTGRRAHPLMQWHAVVGSPDPLNFDGSLWAGTDPDRGNLVPELLVPLCDGLARHTTTSGQCSFGIWEGYANVLGGSAVAVVRSILGGRAEDSESGDAVPSAFSPQELRRPRLHLPGRDYLHLVGPLSAIVEIGWWPTSNWFEPQSPNLFWPADQAWCVASEIDFDSTLVGGTTQLIDDVLQSPAFDSWPVQPDDSLAADADRVNPVPS